MAKQSPKYSTKVIDGVTHITTQKPRRSHMPKVSIKTRQFVIFVVGIVAIVATILVVRHLQSGPNLDVAADMKQVLSQHMIVPNETPVIATVTDKSALKTPFLQESENGDRIVIYEKAKKVVIYRPSIDRIVTIGPVELGNIPGASR